MLKMRPNNDNHDRGEYFILVVKFLYNHTVKCIQFYAIDYNRVYPINI